MLDRVFPGKIMISKYRRLLPNGDSLIEENFFDDRFLLSL